MSSKVRSVFKSMAMKLGVEESDFLTLASAGICTADDFFFRLPTSAKLEDYLEQDMFTTLSYEEGDGRIVNYARSSQDAVTSREWLRSSGAAALRRLWEASKAIAKKDMEKFTEEKAEGDAPRKVTASMAADLEERAVARGAFGVPLDTEKPGVLALGKLIENFRVGGSNKHVKWEDYTNDEEEKRAIRLGLVKNDVGFKLTPTTDGFKTETSPPIFYHTTVVDLISLRDTLKTRAIAFEFLELAAYEDLMQLLEIYERRLKQRVPERMRAPTINEIRFVDRLIFEDVLAEVAKGTGNMHDGIHHWISEAASKHKYWDFLDAQIDTMPDRGIEKKSQFPSTSVPLTSAIAGTHAKGDGTAADKPKGVCFVCSKLRKDHPGGRFCQEAQARKRQGAPLPEKSNEADKKPKTVGGQLPEYMKGYAARTPPSKGQPFGKRFCWLRNHPDGDQCRSGSKCGRSHACPVFLSSGEICMKDHAASKHGN